MLFGFFFCGCGVLRYEEDFCACVVYVMVGDDQNVNRGRMIGCFSATNYRYNPSAQCPTAIITTIPELTNCCTATIRAPACFKITAMDQAIASASDTAYFARIRDPCSCIVRMLMIDWGHNNHGLANVLCVVKVVFVYVELKERGRG